MYILKLALRPWRTLFLSQVFAGCTLGVLLFVAGLLIWFDQVLDPMTERLRSEQVITLFVEPVLESNQISKLEDEIKILVGSQAKEVKLLKGKDFLNEISGFYPKLVQDLEEMGSELNEVIPRFFSITGSFNESTVEQLKKLAGVESSDTSRDRYLPLVNNLKSFRWVIRLLTFGLLIAGLAQLIHLSQMNQKIHQETEALLKLFGTGQLGQSMPSILTGLSVGLLGGAIGFLGIYFLKKYGIATLNFFMPMQAALPLQKLNVIGLYVVVFSIILGIFSSLLSRLRA